MSKNDRGSEGTKPRKKSKALSTFVRLLAAVLGLAVGFALYWIYIFGGTFVAVPVVSKEDYSTLEITQSGSTTGGDVSSSWTDGGHTRLYYDPSHPKKGYVKRYCDKRFWFWIFQGIAVFCLFVCILIVLLTMLFA